MTRRNAAAEAAHRLLGDRLRELTRDDRTVPCHGSMLPISDDPADRGLAALDCPACPALDACHAAGAHELHGVWAGRDMTPKPKTSTRTDRTSTEWTTP